MAERDRKRSTLVVRILRKQPLTLIGVIVLLCVSLVAVFAPYIAPYDPLSINLTNRLEPPSRDHPMGTDTFGRDLLSRVIYGSRISLWVGILSVALGTSVGVPLGLLSGYRGGWVDMLVMRGMDVMLSFPPLVLAMAIAVSIGPGLNSAIIAVGIVNIPRYARLVRSSVLELRETEFVEAARAMGARDSSIMGKHILMNCLSPIVVQATLGLGTAIITAAGLSFIGLGAQAPTPEWGAIISEGRYYVVSGRWWLSIFPGVAIALSVLGFNLAGDGLRDFLDPRAS